MTLRFVLILLFGVLLRAAGSVEVLAAERSSARAVDGGLLSIINEIPTCAVSNSQTSSYISTHSCTVDLSRTGSQSYRLRSVGHRMSVRVDKLHSDPPTMPKGKLHVRRNVQ
jgi:hypothetical protein